MKLIALVGSFLLFIYLLGVLVMTSVNVSRYLFSDEVTGEFFWNRQLTIVLWPLIIISEEGRDTLTSMWNREQD